MRIWLTACSRSSTYASVKTMYSFKVLLDEDTSPATKGKSSIVAKGVSSSSSKQSIMSNGKTASNSSATAAASKSAIAANKGSIAASTSPSGAPAPGRSADGKPVCYNCGTKGHTGDRCKMPYCERCQRFRHVAGECNRACRKCGALDHRIDGGQPCKNYQCKECGLFGHVYAECPNIVCNVCNEYGHLARDCPEKGSKTLNNSSSMSSTTAAAAASTGAPAGQQPPKRQQQQQQQQRKLFEWEDEERRSHVMDLLLSRAEEYALSLLGQEEKLAALCTLSDSQLRTMLSKPNPQQQLESAIQRIQQQQSAASSSSSSSWGAAGAAVIAPSSSGGSSSARPANGTAAAGSSKAASKAADTSSGNSSTAAAISNGVQLMNRDNVCARCGEANHTKEHCSTPKCSDCGLFRHTAGQCSRACQACGGLGHMSGPGYPMCINYKCRECGLYGHVYAVCPNIRCNMCGETGHKALDCPHIVCLICHQKGHKARDCTACPKCGGQGHKARDCPGMRSEVRCAKCGEWGHKPSTCSGPSASPSAAAAAASSATPVAGPSSISSSTSSSTKPTAAQGSGSAVNSSTIGSSNAVAAAVPCQPSAAVAAGGVGAWAAMAAGRRLVTPTNVRLLAADALSNQAAEEARRSWVLNLLMPKVEAYALALVEDHESLSALSKVVDDDLRALLNTPNAEQQIDAAIKHVKTVVQQQQQERQQQLQVQQAPAAADSTAAAQQHVQPADCWLQAGLPAAQTGQEHQQSDQESASSPSNMPGRAGAAETMKPHELLPEYAAALEAEFPSYFPADWQQFTSWRSLEDKMSFPEPQFKSRAQYRQKRQHYQALTWQTLTSRGAVEGADANGSVQQQQQQQQLVQHPVQHPVQNDRQAAADQQTAPVAPATDPPAAGSGGAAADAAPAAHAVPVQQPGAAPLQDDRPSVKLLPPNSLSEEQLGERFNHVLDMMLPKFENFVTSLNEEKWQVLARIDEHDLLGLLCRPQAELELNALLSRVLQQEKRQQQHQQEQQQSQQQHQRPQEHSLPPMSSYQQALQQPQEQEQQPHQQHQTTQQQEQHKGQEPYMPHSQELANQYGAPASEQQPQEVAALNQYSASAQQEQPQQALGTEAQRQYVQKSNAPQADIFQQQQQQSYTQYQASTHQLPPWHVQHQQQYLPSNYAGAAGLGMNSLGYGLHAGLGLHSMDVPATATAAPGSMPAASTPYGSGNVSVGPGAHAGFLQQQRQLAASGLGSAGLQQIGDISSISSSPAGVGMQQVGMHPLHQLLRQSVGVSESQARAGGHRLPPTAPGAAAAGVAAGVAPGPAGPAAGYGALGPFNPYARRSSGGDEAREREMERMMGFLGM